MTQYRVPQWLCWQTDRGNTCTACAIGSSSSTEPWSLHVIVTYSIHSLFIYARQSQNAHKASPGTTPQINQSCLICMHANNHFASALLLGLTKQLWKHNLLAQSQQYLKYLLIFGINCHKTLVDLSHRPSAGQHTAAVHAQSSREENTRTIEWWRVPSRRRE